jgi:hypothetical protein
MSKGIRSLAASLTKSVAKLIGSPYQQISLPVEISLKVETKSGGLTKSVEPLTVTGQTHKLSQNEISFVVPFVRIGEQYLAGHGEQKSLKVFFELPNGKVRMTASPVCYEMINLHDSVQQYLITAQIIQISEGDSARYQDFLKRGSKSHQKQTSADSVSGDQKTSALTILSN